MDELVFDFRFDRVRELKLVLKNLLNVIETSEDEEIRIKASGEIRALTDQIANYYGELLHATGLNISDPYNNNGDDDDAAVGVVPDNNNSITTTSVAAVVADGSYWCKRDCNRLHTKEDPCPEFQV